MNIITKTAHGEKAHPIETDGMNTKAKMITKQRKPKELSAIMSNNLHLKNKDLKCN